LPKKKGDSFLPKKREIVFYLKKGRRLKKTPKKKGEIVFRLKKGRYLKETPKKKEDSFSPKKKGDSE
jgi:hypothetical protein